MTQLKDKPRIVVTRCDDYESSHIRDALQKQFQLLGGLEKFIKPGDSVLLKPNLIAPKPPDSAVQTHGSVILETASLIKDFGAKPFVADSPAWGNVFSCLKALGIDHQLKKLGVPVKQLNKPVKCNLPGSGVNVGVSYLALGADKIINLPKFKTHQQLVATFAVKNMFGCVSGKKKALWHFLKGSSCQQFCQFLIDIFKLLRPALTIIDGVVVMEGMGPIRGTPRPLGCLIAGQDPLACEALCAKMINLQPDDLPMITTAKEINFGCPDLNLVQILGDDYKDLICKDFILAEQYPVRFSLPKILKSISKQILILAKSVAKKK